MPATQEEASIDCFLLNFDLLVPNKHKKKPKSKINKSLLVITLI